MFGADRETSLHDRVLAQRTGSHGDRKSDERTQFLLDQFNEVVRLADPILQSDGIKGLYRGFGITVMREVCWGLLDAFLLTPDMLDTLHVLAVPPV